MWRIKPNATFPTPVDPIHPMSPSFQTTKPERTRRNKWDTTLHPGPIHDIASWHTSTIELSVAIELCYVMSYIFTEEEFMLLEMPKENWTIRVERDVLEGFKELLQADDSPLGFKVGLGDGVTHVLKFLLDSPPDLQKRMLNREITGNSFVDIVQALIDERLNKSHTMSDEQTDLKSPDKNK
jgi:hypothetical protein